MIVSIKTFSSLREFVLVSVEYVLEDAYEGHGVRFQPVSTILQGKNLLLLFLSESGIIFVQDPEISENTKMTISIGFLDFPTVFGCEI